MAVSAPQILHHVAMIPRGTATKQNNPYAAYTKRNKHTPTPLNDGGLRVERWPFQFFQIVTNGNCSFLVISLNVFGLGF